MRKENNMSKEAVLAEAYDRAAAQNDYEALVRIAMAMHNCGVESLKLKGE